MSSDEVSSSEEAAGGKEKKSKDKDKDSDSSSNSSSNSDSESSSDDETPRKSGKAAADDGKGEDGKLKAKAVAKKRHKEPARALITLDDIPESAIQDPQVLWDCEKCFKMAVSDKLTSYYILSPQGDSNKADVLEQEMKPFMSDPSVAKMPVASVCAKLKSAALKLEQWKAKATAWKIDGDDGVVLTQEKTDFLLDFSEYDKCLSNWETYDRTLRQLKQDHKQSLDTAKDRRRELETKVYCGLRNQGLPPAIGKADVLSTLLFMYIFNFSYLRTLI